MSQAKVDRYKEEKANRKKIMAHEKRMHALGVLCGWLILVALVGWIGHSAYRIYENNKPVEYVYTNLDSINDYLSTLSDAE